MKLTQLLMILVVTLGGPFLMATEDQDVVVAVIDTGIDLSNPDLKKYLWTNPGESGLDSQGRPKSSNGVDDDGNGFIDDVHGWNFAMENKNLSDFHGHGTHISGLVAYGNLADQPHPICRVRIMVLKYLDNGQGRQNPMVATTQAINYAVKMGAQIINYSGGGLQPHPLEKAAIEKAYQAGILFVAAAGNEGMDTRVQPFFPASYKIPNIISVAGLNQKRMVTSTSNYGEDDVQLAAPGDKIVSFLPGGAKGPMTGTSQATALVSHSVAEFLSKTPQRPDIDSLVFLVLNSGRYDDSLQNKVKTGTSLHEERLKRIRPESSVTRKN